MKSTYPLFQSHLDLAHQYWRQLVKAEDIVIDATCGKGLDTVLLAQLARKVYAFDIQKEAIEASKNLLKISLSQEIYARVIFKEGCHSKFPLEISEESVKLIVYNLGYLPGGDKNKTTTAETTIESIRHAMLLLSAGGVLSITCYPGHPEGQKEEEILTDTLTTLDPWQWSVCHHRWLNRKKAPSLLILQKKLSK